MRERHENGTHVEQSERKRNAVRIEVAHDGNDVTGRNSLHSRIIGCSRRCDLGEAEGVSGADEKRTLAVTLTAGEIVEQTGHFYAPPT
jgi:hypothetical protein